VNGQAVTFTFAKNITFSDNVPVTAYDYNYSLYALNVAISPSLPTAFSPFIGGVAGPLGLWADTVSNGGYSITMYMNTSSVWNVEDLNVPVLPMHIFQYLNINVADAVEANIDFSQPYGTATSAVPGSTQGTAPASVTYLASLNIGSGPFWLYTINEATGSGILNANQNYFRTAWYDNLTGNEVKDPYTWSFSPTMYIYNPGPSTLGGVAPRTSGTVYITPANLAASNAIAGSSASATQTFTVTLQKYSGGLPKGNIFTGKKIGLPFTGTCTYTGTPPGVVICTPFTPAPTTGWTLTCKITASGEISCTIGWPIAPSVLKSIKGTYQLTVADSFVFLG
jgi:hypothetical protein